METIHEGMTGAAVEDVQDRLCGLGYVIDTAELDEASFGKSTARAVTKFRLDHELDLASDVDADCWRTLVDESYTLGSRTLYLRLPNFHGADVRSLQEALTVLGFSTGGVDAIFGPRTESAVKQFQENVGIFADGMAFQDTFDAIMRLHHVWAGQPAQGPHPSGVLGFARSAEVLEEHSISIWCDHAITRAVGSRVWNLASATSPHSGIKLIGSEDEASPEDDVLFLLCMNDPDPYSGIANVDIIDTDGLPTRIRTAVSSAAGAPPVVRLELPGQAEAYDGMFTGQDAQTIAVVLLDAICMAFA